MPAKRPSLSQQARQKGISVEQLTRQHAVQKQYGGSYAQAKVKQSTAIMKRQLVNHYGVSDYAQARSAKATDLANKARQNSLVQKYGVGSYAEAVTAFNLKEGAKAHRDYLKERWNGNSVADAQKNRLMHLDHLQATAWRRGGVLHPSDVAKGVKSSFGKDQTYASIFSPDLLAGILGQFGVNGPTQAGNLSDDAGDTVQTAEAPTLGIVGKLVLIGALGAVAYFIL